jgi:hypothetical protein
MKSLSFIARSRLAAHRAGGNRVAAGPARAMLRASLRQNDRWFADPQVALVVLPHHGGGQPLGIVAVAASC